MSTSADEPAQEPHPARPWARSRRRPGDDGFGAVEDVLVERVVDRPDHERPRQSNEAAALGLDDMAEAALGHLPPCHPVKPGGPVMR